MWILFAEGLLECLLNLGMRHDSDSEYFHWTLLRVSLISESSEFIHFSLKNHSPISEKRNAAQSSISVECSCSAIQVLGRYGYTKDYPLERYYRDAKVLEIVEGTSEIQRLILAKEILQP